MLLRGASVGVSIGLLTGELSVYSMILINDKLNKEDISSTLTFLGGLVRCSELSCCHRGANLL